MAEKNQNITNVMPDAMIEPITDMELIIAKLQHDGELSKRALENTAIDNRSKEV